MKRPHGFTLVEVLVALAIVAIALMAGLQATTALARNAQRQSDILLAHLEDLYDFYGIETGVRVARKHISWYTRGLVGSAAFRHHMNQLPDIAKQCQAVNDFFFGLAQHNDHLSYTHTENDNDREGLAA